MIAPMFVRSLPLPPLPPDVSVIVAASADASPDPTSALAQYGVLGIILAAALPALWTMVRRESARADRAEARNEEMRREYNALQSTYMDKVIPLMTTAVDTLQDSQQLLRDMARDR